MNKRILNMDIQTATTWMIANIPLASVFFTLFWRKDQKLETKNDQLLEAYKESTKIQEGLKTAIEAHTLAVRDNTELTRQVVSVLNNRHGDK